MTQVTKPFHVRRNLLPDNRTVYEVVAAPDGDTGVVIAVHALPCVADDLALLLNRITTIYRADCSNRTSRELTWDLLCRIDLLTPFL